MFVVHSTRNNYFARVWLVWRRVVDVDVDAARAGAGRAARVRRAGRAGHGGGSRASPQRVPPRKRLALALAASLESEVLDLTAVDGGDSDDSSDSDSDSDDDGGVDDDFGFVGNSSRALRKDVLRELLPVLQLAVGLEDERRRPEAEAAHAASAEVRVAKAEEVVQRLQRQQHKGRKVTPAALVEAQYALEVAKREAGAQVEVLTVENIEAMAARLGGKATAGTMAKWVDRVDRKDVVEEGHFEKNALVHCGLLPARRRALCSSKPYYAKAFKHIQNVAKHFPSLKTALPEFEQVLAYVRAFDDDMTAGYVPRAFHNNSIVKALHHASLDNNKASGVGTGICALIAQFCTRTKVEEEAAELRKRVSRAFRILYDK